MSREGEPLDLERAGWEALSTSGEVAAAFYNDVLASRVVMLLPGGMVIDDRDEAVDAMSGAPWDTFELADERVFPLDGGSAAVVYRASARRGATQYSALFNSTYVREDAHWRLALHQQTPI
jgi:hypothetical protein